MFQFATLLFLFFTAKGTIIYSSTATRMHIMIAHNLQFLFLASLSNYLALFFIVKAVSFILVLLLSISY
jgi:hypothetical protein